MSKDGIEDEDGLARVAGASSADDSTAPDLTDPESTEPDALDIEAEIEAAELAEGSDPESRAGVIDSDDDLDDDPADAEMAVAAAGSSRASARRSAVRGATTAKKEAPTKPREAPQRESLFARLSRFVREVVAELRKVIWPSRKQMITYTIVVIVFLIIMVALVSGLDVLFHLLVSKVLG